MSGLIEDLAEANKTEVHHLVLNLLGKDKIPLSDKFKSKLNRELDINIPDFPYVGFGYRHYWLGKCLKKDVVSPPGPDTDILIAFESNGVCTLVFLEVKAYGHWENVQMKNKADVLRDLFGENGDEVEGVNPHFCMTSPNEPEQLQTCAWPDWMTKPCKESSDPDRYYWVPLDLSH